MDCDAGDAGDAMDAIETLGETLEKEREMLNKKRVMLDKEMTAGTAVGDARGRNRLGDVAFDALEPIDEGGTAETGPETGAALDVDKTKTGGKIAEVMVQVVDTELWDAWEHLEEPLTARFDLVCLWDSVTMSDKDRDGAGGSGTTAVDCGVETSNKHARNDSEMSSNASDSRGIAHGLSNSLYCRLPCSAVS